MGSEAMAGLAAAYVVRIAPNLAGTNNFIVPEIVGRSSLLAYLGVHPHGGQLVNSRGAAGLLIGIILEQTEATSTWLLVGCGIAMGMTWLLALPVLDHPLWREIRAVAASLTAQCGRKGL